MSEKLTSKDKKLNKVSDGELEKLSGGAGPIWIQMAIDERNAQNGVTAAPAQISGGGGGGGGKNKDKKKKDKKKHK